MKAQLSLSPPVYPPLPPDILAQVPYNDHHHYQKATTAATSASSAPKPKAPSAEAAAPTPLKTSISTSAVSTASSSGPSSNEQEGNMKLKKGFEEIDDFHCHLQHFCEEHEHRMLLHDYFKEMIELLKDKEHSQERSFKTYFRTQGALISLLEHAEIRFDKAISLLRGDGARYYPDTDDSYHINVSSNNKNYDEKYQQNDSNNENKEDECKMITMELKLIAACAHNDSAVKTKLIERQIIQTLLEFLFELEKRHRHPLCSDSVSNVVKGSVSVVVHQKAKATSTSTEFQEYQLKKYDLFINLVTSVVQVLNVCCEEDCYDTLLLITRNNTVLPALCGLVKNVLYRKYCEITALNEDVHAGVRTGVRASDAHSIACLRLVTGAASILKSMTFKCQSKYDALVRFHLYMCVDTVCLFCNNIMSFSLFSNS